jgi:SAM-dependent methyltransferase
MVTSSDLQVVRPRSASWLFQRESSSSDDNNQQIRQRFLSASGFSGDKLRWWLFAVTIFWAAFLLFQLEPLIGKFILPWFGGSPAVWTTCMLFFQVLLLAGYAYAHFSLDHVSPANQGRWHLLLLLLAILTLPITPSADWKPQDGSQPGLSILLLLCSSVGLPFFILGATSPLLQAWFVRVSPGRSPYPLYALSNLGSFVALLSYPFLFEPYFRLGQQTVGWSVGFGGFVLLCGGLALDFRQQALAQNIIHTPTVVDDGLRIADHISPRVLWSLWLALPTATSVLLLAVTNALCQDVASVPFLWIVPLSVYLLSFIVCFAQHHWYRRHIYLPVAVVGVFGLMIALDRGSHMQLGWLVAIYSFGLFACCMICHGELFRLRPHPSRLTAYYLTISIGGAIGGLLVAVVAPVLFSIYLEFHIGLFACCALSLFAIAQDRQALSAARFRRPIMAIASLALLVMVAYLSKQVYYATSTQTLVSRNFYGVLRIREFDVNDPQMARRVLRHGAIDHGMQFLAPDKRHLATTYYRPETGIGLALNHLQLSGGRRIGLVGLGVGTLLSYGKADDFFKIYEINPKVVELAQTQFSFLHDSLATQEIVIADARLALEREQPQNFDLLVLDAFSGDAIPMHLLTAEAMQLYLKHLRPDGVLAIHIANHFLDLKPLLRGLAGQEHYQYRFIREQAAADDFGLYRSSWALISRNQAFLQQPAIEAAAQPDSGAEKQVVWRDDFSNLFSLLK